MLQRRSLQSRARLRRWLRRVPLPVLALVTGLGVGLAVWWVLGSIQAQAISNKFDGEVLLRLNQRSEEKRTRFNQYLEKQATTSRLLANHRRLATYLEPLSWVAGEPFQTRNYAAGQRPVWLPESMGLDPVAPPPYVLLMDRWGQMREIYGRGDDVFPGDLASLIAERYADGNQGHIRLTYYQDRPYLLASDAIEDVAGFPMGHLILVIPIDTEFLDASQAGASDIEDEVALLDAGQRIILASSAPALLSQGSSADQWVDQYLVTTQTLFQAEPPESNFLFATFMPQRSVAAISRQVRQLDKRQRVVSALVFLGVFTLGVYLVSARLNRVLRRLSRFSQRALRRPISFQNTSGNQLLLLEEQVRNFIRVVLAARDEMRRRHETRIRETEALKDAILEASLDSIITIDGNGHILEVNSTAEHSFGYRRDEMIGQYFAGRVLAPDSVPRFQTLLEACRPRRPGEPRPFVRGELEAQRADGLPFPVEISIVPILLAATQLHTLYLSDISSRKEAEHKIHSLAKLSSESPNPVLRVTAQGAILYANDASLPLLAYWGCARGQTLPLFWRQRITQVLDSGRAQEWEIHCAGQLLALLFAPMGDQGYVNLYGRDVTEVRRVEQEARQHQAELVHVCRLSTMGEVATGMAHELNQPLSAIVNYASGCSRRLQSGTGATAELVAALGQISSQAQRASEIIRRLRAMVGHQPAVPWETVDINRLVREVQTFVAFDAGRQGVDIDLELHPQPLLVFVDLVQVEQVLLNLVRNAMDALEENQQGKRRVRVQTRPAGDWVEVEVQDNGPGIDPDSAAHLFDAFFTTKDSGMGMGLAISKTIIEEHKGSIRLVSKPGEGARFLLRLPLAGAG